MFETGSNNANRIKVTSRALVLPEVGDDGDISYRVAHRSLRIALIIAVFAAIALIMTIFVVKIDVVVEGYGVLEPVNVWPVRALADGRIVALYVTSGDSVRQGEEIARLESISYEYELAQVKWEYLQYREIIDRELEVERVERSRSIAYRAQAESELIRARAGLREKALSFGFKDSVEAVIDLYTRGRHVGLDLAMSEILSAEARLLLTDSEERLRELELPSVDEREAKLDYLNARMKLLQERIAGMTLRSPETGVVLTENLDRRIGSFLHEGDLLLELADLGAWNAHVLVSERDIQNVRRGDRTVIKIAALRRGKPVTVSGRVSHISSESTARESTFGRTPQVYSVVVKLDSKIERSVLRGAVKRGYSVSAQIITGSSHLSDLLLDYTKTR